jgi:hypothetical protein
MDNFTRRILSLVRADAKAGLVVGFNEGKYHNLLNRIAPFLGSATKKLVSSTKVAHDDTEQT